MGNLKIEAMPQLTKPKPLRKGASEEHIFAEIQKAKTTAALVAANEVRASGHVFAVSERDGRQRIVWLEAA